MVCFGHARAAGVRNTAERWRSGVSGRAPVSGSRGPAPVPGTP